MIRLIILFGTIVTITSALPLNPPLNSTSTYITNNPSINNQPSTVSNNPASQTVNEASPLKLHDSTNDTINVSNIPTSLKSTQSSDPGTQNGMVPLKSPQNINKSIPDMQPVNITLSLNGTTKSFDNATPSGPPMVNTTITNPQNNTLSLEPVTSTVIITKTSDGLIALQSPGYLPKFSTHIKELSSMPTGPLNNNIHINTMDYPMSWTTPNTDHPEVKAAIQAIDWDYVPKLNPRRQEDAASVNPEIDEGCWWTSTLCSVPKVDYLPADVTFCKNPNDFGLTYDDGPLIPTGKIEQDKWAEPHLYDFLAKYNQRATLFYIGSNVLHFPQAAVRAIESGHTICAHTWSHKHMTGLTNEEIVAEFYWNLRVIKEATGVTPKCWRPPFGDIDDRVRAIAHQMGMLTIIWDSDSFDWGLPSVANDFSGTYSPERVDKFFQKWISNHEKGHDQHGHIVLEHETSNMTILVTEKWLPKLKQVFDVKPVHECATELEAPYWESV